MPTSNPLTQSESDLLHDDGVFMMNSVPALMAETLMWAVSFAAYTLRRKQYFHHKPRVILTATILSMFLLSSALFSLHVWEFMYQVKRIYLDSSIEGQSFGDKSSTTIPAINKGGFVYNILFALEFLIGDSIVLWRTWTIWYSSRRIVWLPIFLWISSLGCLLAWILTRVIQTIAKVGWRRFSILDDDPDFLLLTSYVLSLSVNATSTLLIGFKAWQYRNHLKLSYGKSSLTERISRILALLVESGVIYLTFSCMQLINFNGIRTPQQSVSGSASNIAGMVIAGIENQLLGLYPTLIIIIVNLRKTILDSPEESSSSLAEMSTVSGIVFNHIQTLSQSRDGRDGSRSPGV
ncbi:hypothetical protein D9758_011234 [Tetrapyrgos nigripes]|uniref:Uncharacterized protein n=1 Tax=Tetrapyrgos nigripes TaxID=182062 RepID=A0A8H5D6U3_9AGAR|nr:hypothetical protein D9758_011234 [Tetrapyrgos nigripes]